MRDVTVADERQVEVSGAEEVGTFSIAASAKAFKTLIDSLYSDKPRAIIRELWSNAFDSHVMAGIMDRPFDCHLPTVWEPEFSVRDYGVSLTHEQVMKLYTTVFQSTKEDTNSQVGKFGLGSKTPFSYTDTYAIVARLNGEKRIYNAFIDGKGIPRIALFHSEPSDEEQGLEVSFPVQGKDIDAFRRAAQRVALGFDVQPKTNVDVSPQHMAVRLEGDGWKLLERKDYSGIDQAHVRQGCVLYPIDPNAIDRVMRSEAVWALHDEPLVIDMPIGSVDITPSRESLSYDETTCKNIIAKFEEVIEVFCQNASDKIKTAKTLWDAVENRSSVLGNIRNGKLRQQITKGLKWRGRKIPEEIKLDIVRLKKLSKLGLTIKGMNTWSARGARTLPELQEETHISYEELRKTSSRDLVFYYWTGESAPKHLGYRLRALTKMGGIRPYVIPNFKPGSHAHKMLLAMLGRRPTEFRDLMDVPFEKPERKKGLPPLKVLNGGLCFEDQNGDLDEDKQVHWVILYQNHSVRFNGKLVGLSDFQGLIRAAKNRGMWDSDKNIIVGIPGSRKDIAKDLPEDWLSFEEQIYEWLGAFDANAYAAYQVYWHSRLGYDWSGYYSLLQTLGKDYGNNADHGNGLWSEIREDMLQHDKLVDKGSFYEVLWSFTQHMPAWILDAYIRERDSVKPDVFAEQLRRKLSRVLKAYPMLRLISRHTCESAKQRKHVLDYIKMMDSIEAETRLSDFAWDCVI